MRRRAAISIHARLKRVRAVRRGIAQHRKRRGSTPPLTGTRYSKKTPGGAGIASSLSDANPVPCLSDGQGVKKTCKTPLYFSPRPRARSPPPSTAPCERLVSTHARRPPMAPPGMASRGPPPGPSLLTIALDHRAANRLSQERPSFSRTRLDYMYLPDGKMATIRLITRMALEPTGSTRYNFPPRGPCFPLHNCSSTARGPRGPLDPLVHHNPLHNSTSPQPFSPRAFSHLPKATHSSALFTAGLTVLRSVIGGHSGGLEDTRSLEYSA